MIKLIKENLTQYIHRCKVCKSWFIYDIKDYVDVSHDNYNGYVKCPCCKHRNKIKFKIKYKSSKRINENYKSLYEESLKEQERLENMNNNHLLNTKKLNNTIGELNGKIEKYEYNQEKYDKLYSSYTRTIDTISKIKHYIENYLNSDRKNNLATKYIKEIQNLIKII